MIEAGDKVLVIRDGRIGKVTNTHGRIDNANRPGAVKIVEKCMVCFDNDMSKLEWFTPEQLRAVK